MDWLDKITELGQLTDHEREERKNLGRDLDGIWRLEEIKAKQRPREREIKEGNRNTSYFFALANHRKRKKNILCLEDNGIIMEDDSSMLKHAMEFYRKMFGTKSKENIKLSEDCLKMRKSLRRRMKLLKLSSLRIKLGELYLILMLRGP
jgi:hypothetical protein